MARDKLTLLRYEADRKPTVAALVARVADLTDAEIDAAPLLKWMREALRDLRGRERTQRQQVVTLEALEGHIVDGVTPDPMGVTYRWSGPETYLPFGGRTELLVPTGALLWLPEAAPGMWYETAWTPRVDPRVAGNAIWVGLASKSQYIDAYRARANGLMVPATASPEPLSSHGIPGLRITRIP